MVDFRACGGKGPEHFNKTQGIWQIYAKPDIFAATMSYNDLVIPLRWNRFSIDRRGTAPVVGLWHSFEYEAQHGVRMHGRCYNLEFPLEQVQLQDNTFTYTHHNYELDEEDYEDEDRFVDANFTLTFSPAFAQKFLNCITLSH